MCMYFLRQFSKGKGHAIFMTSHITTLFGQDRRLAQVGKNNLGDHTRFKLQMLKSNGHLSLYFAELYYNSISCKCK